MANISAWATTAAGNDTGAVPNFPVENMAPSSVNDTMRENMAAVARWYKEGKGVLVSAGTGNAYTLTTDSSHAALADLPALVFRADRANTGAATLAVDGLTAKALVGNDGAALAAGDIVANQIIEAVYNSTTDKYHIISAQPRIPVGTLSMFLGASAPSGWLLADGSAVSRSTFASLFAIIGTTFGAGDGSTTFNLPDMRSRSPLGAGQGAGLTNRTLGATLGEEAHALVAAENGPHNHGGSTNTTGAHTHPPAPGFTDFRGQQAGGPFHSGPSATNEGFFTQTGSAGNHNHTIPSDGSGTPHNNMQPSLVVNFIIKH